MPQSVGAESDAPDLGVLRYVYFCFFIYIESNLTLADLGGAKGHFGASEQVSQGV